MASLSCDPREQNARRGLPIYGKADPAFEKIPAVLRARLEHDPKSGIRFPKDHTQTKTGDHDRILLNRIMI
jgi:hypothetical protein